MIDLSGALQTIAKHAEEEWGDKFMKQGQAEIVKL